MGIKNFLHRLMPERRNLNGSQPITADDLISLTSGPVSGAGKQVNEKNALQFTAVFAAIKVLAESISSLPLITYSDNGTTRKRALTHPAYSLLHDSPNPMMTAAVLSGPKSSPMYLGHSSGITIVSR